MNRTRILVSVGVVAAAIAPATAAVADGPGWTNARILDCGEATYEVHLAPAGFGSAFHLDDGTAVIVPWHVEVLWPEELGPDWVTTYDRGSASAAVQTISCEYTDPKGLDVRFDGVLTPARR